MTKVISAAKSALNESEDEDYDGPSKSQVKRDMLALQALGTEIVELTDAKFESIAPSLPEKLRIAVTDARSIRAHGGRKRQLQYIGRLMRQVDPQPIRDALAVWKRHSREQAVELHQLEAWRERLVREPEALHEYVASHPGTDTQRLRALIRNTREEQARNKPPKSYRELFRMLRDAGKAAAGDSLDDEHDSEDGQHNATDGDHDE
jgi:ribosome-associated protein